MQTTLGFGLGKLAAFVAASLIGIVILAWISALAGISFVRVHTEIGIDASPETVWAVISASSATRVESADGESQRATGRRRANRMDVDHRIGGIATLVVRGFLRNEVRSAYEAHNWALKTRAEALGARR